jgi:hypothetical protein
MALSQKSIAYAVLEGAILKGFLTLEMQSRFFTDEE